MSRGARQRRNKRNKTKPEESESYSVNVPVPRQLPSVQGRAVSSAIKELVELILTPSKPVRIPRPTAPLVHPVLYRSTVTLAAVDGDHPLEAIVRVNMDLRKHIQIFSNSASITTAGGAFTTLSNGSDFINFPQPLTLSSGKRYSFPFTLENATGGQVSSAEMTKTVEDWGEVYAFDPSTKLFRANYVWTYRGNLNSVSRTVNCSGRAGLVPNPDGCVLRLQVSNLLEGLSYPGSSLDCTFAAEVSAGTYTIGSPGDFTLFYIPVADRSYDGMAFSITNATSTTNGYIERDIPVAFDRDFKSLIENSRKISLSAGDAILLKQEAASNSGIVACALLPHGQSLPIQVDAAIDEISKLPAERTYTGVPKEGLHTSWIPDTIDQWYLRPTSTVSDPNFSWADTYQTQTIWFVIKIPAAGNAQIPQFIFQARMNIEAENYSTVYGAKSCGASSVLMTAVIDALGTCSVCSGNPGHVRKLQKAVSRVSKDPTVRMLAGAALKAAKVVAPTLLAL